MITHISDKLVASCSTRVLVKPEVENKTLERSIVVSSIFCSSLISLGYGHAFFFALFANIASLILFYKLDMKELMWLQVFFGLTSVVGIYTNFIN